MKGKQHWYKLDNAGKLYSSVNSKRSTTVFRASVTLYQDIETNILQEALNNVMNRFPYFNVYLKRGYFWYYLSENKKKPKIQAEEFFPCMTFNLKKKNSHLFRVLYFNKKISVEFSHILTDGFGAIFFMKSLLLEYFTLIGVEIKEIDEFLRSNYIPSDDEFDECFRLNYNKKIPILKSTIVAHHFKYKLLPKGEYHLITGIVPLEQIYAKAKSYNVTITEYLCAVYFETIIETVKHKKSKVKPIVLNVPVNLRKFYNSKTMRNFFMSVYPKIDVRLGDYSFDELIQYVHNYMQVEVDVRHINQQIGRNIKNENKLFYQLIPLNLKNIIMPWVYRKWGEKNYTTGISNMGIFKVPDELNEHIERFEVCPPPSEGNQIKMTLITYQDEVFITFGNLTVEKEIEKLFFRKLIKHGLNVKIESNV